MSKLLIDEYPLIVLPTLARVLGLNEAIFLQQLNYWLNSSRHDYDDRKWVYNTLEEWQEQLPFFEIWTIKRIIKSLREQGIVITTSQYNKMPMDRTLWYSIDREKLDWIILHSPLVQIAPMPVNGTPPSDQNAPTIVANCDNAKLQNDPSNNQRLLPETTTAKGKDARDSVIAPQSSPSPAPAASSSRIDLDLPTPPTVEEMAKRRQPAQPKQVDEGTAAPGRLVVAGTGIDAYWILREYTAQSLTSTQKKVILATVTDLALWRKICERWAEVYGENWRKFGHLDWYRAGGPPERGHQSPSKPAFGILREPTNHDKPRTDQLSADEEQRIRAGMRAAAADRAARAAGHITAPDPITERIKQQLALERGQGLRPA